MSYHLSILYVWGSVLDDFGDGSINGNTPIRPVCLREADYQRMTRYCTYMKRLLFLPECHFETPESSGDFPFVIYKEHEGGHVVPQRAEDVREVASFLERCRDDFLPLEEATTEEIEPCPNLPRSVV